ncbi:hypothetical protein [Cupriavidus sp. D39]|uniref:hypothetical protein n=1 Tax=Cupriavidus sp. D39 TaxID=2997877 RepID=UPI0022721CD0|nr:hypothetical protein [Cupriavidus sp. D39]MCY0855367.1 hypothetical protein [Cupriavidus sp. D39]
MGFESRRRGRGRPSGRHVEVGDLRGRLTYSGETPGRRQRFFHARAAGRRQAIGIVSVTILALHDFDLDAEPLANQLESPENTVARPEKSTRVKQIFPIRPLALPLRGAGLQRLAQTDRH